MDEAVKELKFQHGTVNGTVEFTEDEEMQVKTQQIMPTWHSHCDWRNTKPI